MAPVKRMVVRHGRHLQATFDGILRSLEVDVVDVDSTIEETYRSGMTQEVVPWTPPADVKLIPAAEAPGILKKMENHYAAKPHEGRSAAWEGGNATDQRIAAAYKAVEQGRQLLNLRSVLHQHLSYQDYNGRQVQLPRLAVARADLRGVRCTVHHNGWLRFTSTSRFRPFTYELQTQSWERGRKVIRKATAICSTPRIPPALRPTERPLGEYLLLWESAWKRVKVRRFPDPPQVHLDPALLEPVVGDLYLVVAAWDLTALELAALGG